MPVLCLVGILAFWLTYAAKEVNTDDSPPIKDIDRFSRETIGMSTKEIKDGLRYGRW